MELSPYVNPAKSATVFRNEYVRGETPMSRKKKKIRINALYLTGNLNVRDSSVYTQRRTYPGGLGGDNTDYELDKIAILYGVVPFAPATVTTGDRPATGSQVDR